MKCPKCKKSDEVVTRQDGFYCLDCGERITSGLSDASACSPLVALSIRQPWAWLILHAGKDIENRCWPTRFRGRVLIHAAKGCTKAEYEDALWFAGDFEKRSVAQTHLPGCPTITVPELKDIPRGGIVGEMEIVDCVRKSGSCWFMGEYGFVIRNAKPLPFQPCKGALGFFNPVTGKCPSDLST
jgi:hypothetical protein